MSGETICLESLVSGFLGATTSTILEAGLARRVDALLARDHDHRHCAEKSIRCSSRKIKAPVPERREAGTGLPVNCP
jgi:hypothetical protein